MWKICESIFGILRVIARSQIASLLRMEGFGTEDGLEVLTIITCLRRIWIEAYWTDCDQMNRLAHLEDLEHYRGVLLVGE